MTEVVRPRDGGAVALRPCPPWCALGRHFAGDDVIHAGDGFHHYGPEIAVPTSDRWHSDEPEIVVRTILKSWTGPLGAEPGPPVIEVNLGTAGQLTDACAELTPAQARDLAAALIELAAAAERPGAG